jgi:hypothetical protein
MTPQEALQILDTATSSIQTNYQNHLKIKEALRLLAEKAFPKEEAKKASK